MWIRTVKTKSGKRAVQVVSKRRGKLTVHQHIGSYQTETEKTQLIFQANIYIKRNSPVQPELWDQADTIHPTGIKITDSQPLFLYRLLARTYDRLGLNGLGDPLVKDLILARLYQPVSKRETADILADAFGRNYSLKTIYRHVKKAMANGMKEKFQTALIDFARQSLSDGLRLVFYDVTTLAFASQAQKGLKDFGFSKDHRNQDVQVVVGLVVNRDGFPVYFDVFSGKTFEGHTFIQVIEQLVALLKNPELVVVADAAMLSQTNLEALEQKHLGFIVGARLANLPHGLQKQIAGSLSGQDQKTGLWDYRNYKLVCQYSTSRADKDRFDRGKQLARAQVAALTPGKISRRFRFLTATGESYAVNTALVERVRQMEGIKGYLTNTQLDPQTIIDRYHDLWRIEKAFRISKTDLEARPIFLQLDQTITCHLLIVFAGLAIARYLELQTKMSIHTVLKAAQKLLTHQVTILQTGETGLVETTVENPKYCGQLEILRNLEH